MAAVRLNPMLENVAEHCAVVPKVLYSGLCSCMLVGQ